MDFKRFLESNFYGKDLLAAVILSFFYILPLILANVYYQDDVLRASFGEEGWISDGRPFSALLMVMLEGHYILADIAPLGLILSVIILSSAGIVIGRVMFPKNENWQVRSIIASLTCMSPFYLGNFSFRYDALPMSVTQYVAIIVPFLVIKNKFYRILLNFLAIIFILCTYQASINTFLASSLLYSIIKARNEYYMMDSFRQFIENIIIVVTSALIYTLIASHFITKNSYAGEHSGIISFNANIFLSAYSNFMHGFHLVNLLLMEPLAWVIIVVYFIGIYYNFKIFLKKIHNSVRQNKFLCVFYIISPLFFLF